MPSSYDMQNPDFSSHCKHVNALGNKPGEPIRLPLDTSREDVIAGRVYVFVIPDFSAFTGDFRDIWQCKQNYKLYKNTEIKRFDKPIRFQVLNSEGQYSATHLTAAVPVIMREGAKSLTGYGDKLFVKYNATKQVQLCISDKLEDFYP